MSSRALGGRRFDYDRRLLPNDHLARLDPEVIDPEYRRISEELARLGPEPSPERRRTVAARLKARERWLGDTALSMGFPAWNLLYFTLSCSLDPRRSDHVVVETGTNTGLSTIVMAQALGDLGLQTKLETADLDPGVVESARRHVAEAGLSDRVIFHVQDSLDFLRGLVARVQCVDFAFVDDRHDPDHVLEEARLLCPAMARPHGTIYFDNTLGEGVGPALAALKEEFGGNLIELPNCSWLPPGNAIWQPERDSGSYGRLP